GARHSLLPARWATTATATRPRHDSWPTTPPGRVHFPPNAAPHAHSPCHTAGQQWHPRPTRPAHVSLEVRNGTTARSAVPGPRHRPTARADDDRPAGERVRARASPHARYSPDRRPPWSRRSHRDAHRGCRRPAAPREATTANSPPDPARRASERSRDVRPAGRHPRGACRKPHTAAAPPPP